MSSENGRSRWQRTVRWLLLPVALLVVVALRAVYSGYGGDERAAGFHGVALGMSPLDVRARFVSPVPGRWRSESAEGDLALVYEPAGQAARTPTRFEFHGGILVAVRAVVSASDPAAQGRPLGVSSASVIARRGRTDGRVEVTLLARDCPTHAEEVRRLIARR